jgi:predicted transglutaminase-like cysteine proteinase
MTRFTVLQFAVLLASCSPQPAFAADCRMCEELGLAPQFTYSGQRVTYLGAREMCERQPELCKTFQGPSAIVRADDRLMDLLARVNRSVNADFPSMTDQDQYGQVEYWALPGRAADCEDFALEKKRRLMAAGVPAGAMQIVVATTERGEDHALLGVSTDKGFYLLDNRFMKLRTVFSRPHYVFQAIQVPTSFRHFDYVNGVRM